MMTMINQSHRFSCHLQDLIMKKKSFIKKKENYKETSKFWNCVDFCASLQELFDAFSISKFKKKVIFYTIKTPSYKITDEIQIVTRLVLFKVKF